MTIDSPAPRVVTMARKELLLWLFWAGAATSAFRYFSIGNAPLFWLSVGQINVFLFGAFLVAGHRLSRYAGKETVQPADFAAALLLLAILVMAGLLPRLIGIGVYYFCFALWLFRIGDRTRELFAAAIVMSAVVTHVLFAPLIFRSFQPLFLWMDAQLVGHVLQFFDPDFSWTGTQFSRIQASGNFGIVIAGACSSFNAVSVAVLAHLAWAMALRKSVSRWDGVALLGTLAFATALNVARLVLTAQGPEGYAFWHGSGGGLPTGALIFIAVQNLALLAAGYATARWAGRPDQ
jgi:hypothetical protein